MLNGPGHLGRGCRVLPGVNLLVDECGAEKEVEIAGETGGPDALTLGGRRRIRMGKAENRGEWAGGEGDGIGD